MPVMSNLISILHISWKAAMLTAFLAVAACGGGEGDGAAAAVTVGGSVPPNAYQVEDMMTIEEAARFLNHATFGATESSIDELVQLGYSEWFVRQLSAPQRSILDTLQAEKAAGGSPSRDDLAEEFWRSAITNDDQLRQRMAFALSQIAVISYDSGDIVNYPLGVAAYMDMLSRDAFGSYRTLLDDVTYSPVMAIFLTYLRNAKADPSKGSVPDENYAREVMQLFSIGLVELNQDGSPKLDAQGNTVETYSTIDVTEMAKVFTGLSWKSSSFFGAKAVDAEFSRLQMFDDYHSTESKTFLATTIPAGTLGNASISMALDRLATHDNTAPFVSRQLIQRFVTSNPSPEYILRIASVFASGSFTLPDGRAVGTGQRGDLTAILAAILFDPEARDPANITSPRFGKIREPVIRFAHWARAFPVNSLAIDDRGVLKDTLSPERLSQQAFRSPSVFNFYRPGYVAPGTESGGANLYAPELQITNEASVTGYMNFMRSFIDDTNQSRSFVPNFGTEIELADRPDQLVERLNLLLTAGAMHAQTRQRMIDAISSIQISQANAQSDRLRRVQAATLLATTSTDYIVQR